MIKLYKAFILPHFKYVSPMFIGLSKGLSAKLESTNALALRTFLNHSKSTAYEELLNNAHIKSLEHRCIEQALYLHTKVFMARNRTTFGKCLSCVATVTAYGAILRLLFQDQPCLMYNILSRTMLVNTGTIYQTKKGCRNPFLHFGRTYKTYSSHRITATVCFVNRQSNYQYFL